MRKRATRSALGAAVATDDSLVTRSLVPASLDSLSLFFLWERSVQEMC